MFLEFVRFHNFIEQSVELEKKKLFFLLCLYSHKAVTLSLCALHSVRICKESVEDIIILPLSSPTAKHYSFASKTIELIRLLVSNELSK